MLLCRAASEHFSENLFLKTGVRSAQHPIHAAGPKLEPKSLMAFGVRRF